LYIVMFNAMTRDVIQIAGMNSQYTLSGESYFYGNAPYGNGLWTSSSWVVVNETDRNSIAGVPVGFALCWANFVFNTSLSIVNQCPKLKGEFSAFGAATYQTYYTNPLHNAPPLTNVPVDCGIFGNPNADGKCEDLIHELVTILEYN
jgi:hypothetical protein